LAAETQEQPGSGVLHLRERVSEVHAVRMTTRRVESVGDRLGDPDENRREVHGEDLGVEVLTHAQGAASGEILDLHAAFGAFALLLDAPPQVMQALENMRWKCRLVEQRGRQYLGFPALEGDPHQAHDQRRGGQTIDSALAARLLPGVKSTAALAAPDATKAATSREKATGTRMQKSRCSTACSANSQKAG
jgi:hypothetical protein